MNQSRDKRGNKPLPGEVLDEGIWARAAISSPAMGLATSGSGKPPSAPTGPLAASLSSVESGPPAKGLPVTQLSGLFLRRDGHPRRGLDSISFSFCLSDVRDPSNVLSKAILLAHHLKTLAVPQGAFKTSNMEFTLATVTPF